MKYFHNINTLDELKKEYRRLAMIHHPDRGGDLETMKAINAEHDELFKALKEQHNKTADEFHRTTESPDEFRKIIEKLMELDGLTIELCGSWLWIGGNTKENKDALKEAGCRWSNNKKLWYWRHEESSRPWHRGKKSIDEIRSKYGSQVFGADGRETSGYARIGATA